MSKRVLVLSGGETERQVSLDSGSAVCAALQELGYEICSVDPSQAQSQYHALGESPSQDFHAQESSSKAGRASELPSQELQSKGPPSEGSQPRRAQFPAIPTGSKKSMQGFVTEKILGFKPDVVLNMLHGGWGEGGPAQSLLESLDIAHNGTNSTSAYICLNKDKASQIARQLGITCPRSVLTSVQHYFSSTSDAEEHEELAQWNIYPHMIKQPDGGSTINIHKIESPQDKLRVATRWQIPAENQGPNPQMILVEQFIKGLEYTVAVFNDEIFGGFNVEFPKAVFDYELKYSPDSPASHTDEYKEYAAAYATAKDYSLRFYKHLKCTGFVRFDFIIDSLTSEPYFLEANNNPGMTPLSLVPDIAKRYKGLSYNQLIKLMVDNCRRTWPISEA